MQHLAEGNQKKTAAAPLVAILSADNEFHEELPNLFPHFPQAKDAVFGERSVREGNAALNAALQAAYFIIGIRAAGLAAGPMTGLDFAGVQKEFLDGDPPRSWSSTSASRARTPGSRAPRDCPTTRSSPPSETHDTRKAPGTHAPGAFAMTAGPRRPRRAARYRSGYFVRNAFAISVSWPKDPVPATTVVEPLSVSTRAS